MSTSFSYTPEEGRQIISTTSLLEELDSSVSPDMDIGKKFSDLKNLMIKDTKLDLHGITLSDYWRNKLIPRGLRLRKFPAYGGMDKTNFKNKWEAILNKCSFDLMLLLIEEAKKDREALKGEIEDLQKTIAQYEDCEHIKQLELKLKEDLQQFTQKLKQEKLRKFKRDDLDYKKGNVYTWKKQTFNYTDSSHLHRRPRTVSFNITSSDDEHLSTNSTTEEGDYFLDRREKQQKGKKQRTTTTTKQGQPRNAKQNQQEEGEERNTTKRTMRSRKGTQ